MDLLSRFKEFIAENDLYDGNTTALLTVSGGLDSVVLAHLWHSAGWPMAIAHCNFQLRGEASDGDESFVRQLAENYQAPFYFARFETARYAEEKSVSIQVAARELRYDWFGQLSKEGGFAPVVTAHHLNDSLETAMMHFIRGTGLKGLTGIPVRQDQVIRPLLFATRAELEAYAALNGLKWRDDESNATDYYTRNFVRLNITPLIRRMNPNFEESARRSLQILSDTRDNYDFLLRSFLTRASERDDEVIRFDKQLIGQSPALGSLLFDLFYPYGFTSDQLLQLAAHWEQSGFELLADSGYRLIVDRDAVLLSEKNAPLPSQTIAADDLMVTLSDGTRLFQQNVTHNGAFPDGRSVALVSAARLVYPLLVRPWRAGDVFQPFGMLGKSQKLQDFLTNLKLSRLEKEQIWLLVNGDDKIIWVPGYRLDERFKISGPGEQAVKFTWVV